ncbi:MAG: uroporphyrinogen-III C-methyltransferase [Halothiobacillaceae bacterium]
MTEERNSPETAPSAPPATEKPVRPSRPRGAGLALALSLLALAGTGAAAWLAWEQNQAAQARLAELERSLHQQLAQRASQEALDTLGKGMESLRQALDTRQQTLEQAMTARLESLRADIDALREEARAQQQALDTLRALTGRDERLWRLSEIERLLTAAQTRLRLLDDASTARLLLQEADRTAAPLGGEALPLREALQQAIANTNGTRLDREGIALRLTQLAEALPDLPRAQASVEVSGAAPEDGWWPTVKGWVSGWLHIERKTPPTPDRDAVLAEAATRLLQARRALLARDTEQALTLVRQALDNINTRLETSDTRVRAALDDLHAIAETLAHPAPTQTDLTPAFSALRTLRNAEPAAAPQQGD